MGTATSFDSNQFRSVLGCFATGVTLITGCNKGTPVGLAANAFTSVSLDPPYVLVCVARASTTWPSIKETGRFAVNFLSEQDEELCRKFSRSGEDRFAGVEWRAAMTGSPVLADALAYVDCELATEHEAGDHDIVLGHVVDLGQQSDGRPLLFWRGGYGRLAE
ncbi:MAG: flavin reductase family protein [Acidimicrobiia bacterium]